MMPASTAKRSAYNIRVAPEDTGLLKYSQTQETADKASSLLQKDLVEHHVFFNESGFHNHISHHILALFGTGSPAGWLTKGWDANVSYQRDALVRHASIVDELASWDTAQKRLGKEQYYPDFLLFYQREIERLGWQETLKQHVFNPEDPRAEDLLARMFAGFLHPMIQLMYGVEFDQPAIVAEGLAQASVHRDRLSEFLHAAEKGSLNATGKMPSILELMHEAAADPKISTAAHINDDNKIYDGILKRAPEETIKLCSKVHVNAEELEERTAEMFQTAIYVALAAAIHPPKEPKVDFFLMHHVNVSPIFIALNAQPWLTTAAKVRLLEWKIRMDIAQYAARGCPKLLFDGVLSYEPRSELPGGTSASLLPRMHAVVDDGHSIKLARAIEVCKQISSKFSDKPWAQFKDEAAWLKAMALVLESVEGKSSGGFWVRSAGFEEMWKDVPDRT